MQSIYINPLNGRSQKPKQIYIENKNESFVIYDCFGTDWIVNKQTGEHRRVRSIRFDIVFDNIKENIPNF